MKYNIKTQNCYKLQISFDSTEGLNKFINFLSENKIIGLGFDNTEKNIHYTGFFTQEEINKIKEKYSV